MSKNLHLTALAFALGLGMASVAQAAPVSLGAQGSTYVQNFDSLSNVAGSTDNAVLPEGWVLAETGGGARDNQHYAVDTGSSNVGDVYSYGAAGSTDRALGSLRSGTLSPLFGVEFINGTGATITSLNITFTGEQWRLGTASRLDRLAFQYSTNANSLTTGDFTEIGEFEFTSPGTTTIGAKNGNDPLYSATISAAISGLDLAANSTFWIRWIDVDASGSDDGLAIDNFSLTARGAALPVPQAVPEPASLMLLGLALAGLVGVRRRG